MTIHSESRQTTAPARSADLATLLRSRRSVRVYQDRSVLVRIYRANVGGGSLGTIATWQATLAFCRADSPGTQNTNLLIRWVKHGNRTWRWMVRTRQSSIFAWRNRASAFSTHRPSSFPACILKISDRYPDEQRQADETTMAI